ncbi:MAG TPA: hypothetical protein VGD42_16930 [Lysobacter sp.]
MTSPRLTAFVLAGGLLAMAPASAQDAARALDLSVPQTPIHFEGTAPEYRNDPPGTWYGDHGGPAAADGDAAPADGDWRVHGAVEAGVGWSSHGGSSNWQAFNLNLDRIRTGDDGDTSRVNIDINVGRGEGPVFGPGYFAPDYLDAPMPRGRPPFVR